MNHDIDLWGEYPPDNRWDQDQNAKLLNILFKGGTFGNFLKFFLDKFSKLSPALDGDTFGDTGTSHNFSKIKFSGLIQRYHASFINDNEDNIGLPLCIITPSTKKHFLYLKKAQLFRAGDRKITPNDLWQKSIGEMKEKLPDDISSIKELYKLEGEAYYSWIPKFIIRDWYKLEFLQDLEDTHNYQWFDTFKTHKFFEGQKVFHLDLETFFNWDTFIMNIKELDNFFGLALDHDRHAEMKDLFLKGLELDAIRKECNLVESVLENKYDEPFNDLDVSTEGFIYAEIEKTNDFIQMPLTNRFFRDTGEMQQFIEHYPEHYKAMNPNMPKFNGISNPYYLDKNK